MITARTSSSTRTLSLIHIHAVAAAWRGSEEEAKHETIKTSRREILFRLRVRFSGEEATARRAGRMSVTAYGAPISTMR